jgi:hypothetical protein
MAKKTTFNEKKYIVFNCRKKNSKLKTLKI